ncbi:MAG: ABC transporter permease [Chloroflexi bacterium]|nr:ABC transporter permease [Chloroflexota bacterium]
MTTDADPAAAAPGAGPADRRDWGRYAGLIVPPALVFVAAVALWEAAVEVFEIQRFLLPRPSEIVSLFFEDFSRLINQGRNTLGVAGRGLVLGGAIGIGLAALSFRTRWMAEGLGIYAAVLKAVPVISLAPLTVVWFGIEAGSKIATVSIATAPILFTFTLVGLRRADPNAQELMRSYAAGRLRTFWSLHVPYALPFFFSGLKISVTIAMIVAIISEYFGGSFENLGGYIRNEANNVHTVEVWTAIVMACALGIGLYMIVAIIDRFVLRWHSSKRGG